MKPIFTSGVFSLILGGSVFLLASCATGVSPRPDPAPANISNSSRSEGHAILYELVSKQKDVSKILIIKKEKSDVHAVIKSISEASRDATKKLEAFAKQDRTLNLKEKHLPTIEEKTRASIESARTKQLLGSSGRKFELQLLLTQTEALSYGTHLARSLAIQEANAGHRDFLLQLSRQLDGLYLQVLNLITSRYTREA